MSEDIFEQLRDATMSPTLVASNHNEPSLLLRPATPPLVVPSPTVAPKSPSGRPRSPLPPSDSRSPSYTLSPPPGTPHRRPSTSRQRSSSRLDLIDNERIKASLQEATDRVQYEVRRADEAANRAEYSEHQASQVCLLLPDTVHSHNSRRIELQQICGDEASVERDGIPAAGI